MPSSVAAVYDRRILPSAQRCKLTVEALYARLCKQDSAVTDSRYRSSLHGSAPFLWRVSVLA
jgi:hypothetical protein